LGPLQGRKRKYLAGDRVRSVWVHGAGLNPPAPTSQMDPQAMVLPNPNSSLFAKSVGIAYDGAPLSSISNELPEDAPEITQLLSRMSEGNAEARNQVWELLHEQLRKRAGREAEGAKGLLQATELINIAFTKVDRLEGKDWSNRRHFVSVAALAMRSAVVDHLRSVGRKGPHTLIDTLVNDVSARVDGDVLGFYDELANFAKTDPLMAHALELRALGYEKSEIAEHLGIAERTFHRRFERARAHLKGRL